ncbi:MAG: hypothetical protein R3Y44_07675, partial [Rikenellaceae bacterium]
GQRCWGCKPASTPASSPADMPSGEIYTVQLLSSAKVLSDSDSQFKVYRNNVWYFEASGSYKYKYCTGRYATREEAERELSGVKKYFSDAFVVKYTEKTVN